MKEEKTQTRIRQVYDQIAARFAEDHAVMPAEVVEAGEQFLALRRVMGPVLELGCGAGRDLAWLEGRGCQLVGADLSAGMLAEARGRARADLCQAEMGTLCFAAASFAGLWCNAALLHLPRAEAPGALAEMYRVLSPGAPLFLRLQLGDGEAWETRPNRPARLFTRYQEGELKSLLQTAGFSIHEIQTSQVESRAWLHALALRR
jgi:ubiquinone/menaquinone biosynthesis C-methylase UbiE